MLRSGHDRRTESASAPPSVPAVRVPRRRGTELALIVVAVLLSVYGYCAVGLAKNDTVPPGAAGYGAGLGAARPPRPSRGPLPRPVRRSAAAADRRAAQRPRSGARSTGSTWRPRATRRRRPSWSGPRSASRSSSRSSCFLRDHRVLQRYAYISRRRRARPDDRADLLPGRERRPDLDQDRRILLPARRVREDPARDLLRRYLAANRNALAYTGRTVWKLAAPAPAGCSGRSSRSGCSASASWSSNGTWAPRCSSSGSS